MEAAIAVPHVSHNESVAAATQRRQRQDFSCKRDTQRFAAASRRFTREDKDHTSMLSDIVMMGYGCYEIAMESREIKKKPLSVVSLHVHLLR